MPNDERLDDAVFLTLRVVITETWTTETENELVQCNENDTGRSR